MTKPYIVVITERGAIRVTVVREVKGERIAKVYGQRRWFTLPETAEVYAEDGQS